MAEEKKAEGAVLAPGEVVTCVVEQIMPYGAFVRIKSGQRAMIHISELSHSFVKKVEDILTLNQEVQARVIKIDEKGRIDLSLKKMEAPRPAPSSRGAFTPAAPEDPRDSFEKKLSNYLKQSEAKIADLNSKMNNSRAAKKRGKPAK